MAGAGSVASPDPTTKSLCSKTSSPLPTTVSKSRTAESLHFNTIQYGIGNERQYSSGVASENCDAMLTVLVFHAHVHTSHETENGRLEKTVPVMVTLLVAHPIGSSLGPNIGVLCS